MSISALGYIGIRSGKLDDWRRFGPAFLGLQLVEASRSQLVFRMDDRAQRVIVTADEEEGRATFGWEVENIAALDALAARLEAARVQVTRLGRAGAEQRRVADAIAFCDPAGNLLEAYCGGEIATDAFAPGRPIAGFRTGALGMGHVVLHVKSIDDLMWFYTDVLDFRLTDFVVHPYRVFFFHVNARHHSLAMVESGKSGVHHLMMELYSLDDVGQAHDAAQAEEGRLGVTLGRHTNDFMTSFYAYTPSGFMVEYGWGGRSIEPEGWTPYEMMNGSSLWGHDRLWMRPEDLAEMRRIRATAVGLREPVQVIDGNYKIGPGACPWFDRLREAAE